MGFVACPPVSVQDHVTLRELHTAWKQARKNKQASGNQARFDTDWAANLIGLQERLNAGTWSPAPSTCFIAQRPKAREIHAPDFSDRVVHHWLIPQLEAIFEAGFIHSSFSNRKGKGTHAAVDQLRDYIRQVHSGQGGGWYLQLDVHNFFNCIHRPTLYPMLKARIERAGLGMPAQQAVHALLRASPISQGVIYRATAQERALVPLHKRLEHAGAGRGLPIGNLSSQFFANVYLDALDHFVKHTLKAQRYVRYVDDFVLVHRDRDQLVAWQAQIERFLAEHLWLRLKDETKLKPLTAGVDFLGYVLMPTHTTVRRRVVAHAREHLSAFQRNHVDSRGIHATREERAALRSIWASYNGHFSHAATARLVDDFHRRYPWLRSLEAA